MNIPDSIELRNTAAGAIESAGTPLRTGAPLRRAAVERCGTFGDAQRKTAERIGLIAGYLQRNNLEDMIQDAERCLRQRPERSLAAAAALGFVLGAALRKR